LLAPAVLDASSVPLSEGMPLLLDSSPPHALSNERVQRIIEARMGLG
jgi:hypothetical protein